MEIRFCDRCQESIPDAEFDAGRALHVEGRNVHVACALGRAMSLAGPRSWLVFALALYAAGVATFLLVGALAGDDDAEVVPVAVQTRIQEAVGDAGHESATRLEARLRSERDAIDGRVATALQTQAERDRDARRALEDRMLQGERLGRDHRSAFEQRLGRMEGEVRALNELVREAMAQAAAAGPARPVVVDPPPREPEPAEEPVDPEPMVAAEPAERPPGHDAEVDRWMRRLDDDNENIRFSATLELGRLKDLRAAPALIKVLEEDRDYYVRLGAATALGEIKAADAMPALIEALMDRDALVRTAANDAIWAIVGDLPEFETEESREAYHFVSEMSASERRRVQRRWRDWWRSNEEALRAHLGQPRG